MPKPFIGKEPSGFHRMDRPKGDLLEVGVDEVGRGSLIYDVVAAAVMMPSEYDEDDVMVSHIRDSKKISKKDLHILADYIKTVAIAWGIGRASKEEITTHNILNATMLAMHRALDEVYKQVAFDTIVVDGNTFRPYLTPCLKDDENTEYIPHKCIIDGDKTNLSIAAASIIAKVERDNDILVLCEKHPTYKRYGWETNFGYGTKQHFEALQRFGITEYHRPSFLKKHFF